MNRFFNFKDLFNNEYRILRIEEVEEIVSYQTDIQNDNSWKIVLFADSNTEYTLAVNLTEAEAVNRLTEYIEFLNN